MATGRVSPASTSATAGRAGWWTSLQTGDARVQTLAGQELVGQRLRRVRRPLEQPVLLHPAPVGVPLGRVLPAVGLVVAGGEEDRQRGLHDRLLQAALEAFINASTPVAGSF